MTNLLDNFPQDNPFDVDAYLDARRESDEWPMPYVAPPMKPIADRLRAMLNRAEDELSMAKAHHASYRNWDTAQAMRAAQKAVDELKADLRIAGKRA